jgi:hypothetical protein
MADISKIVMEEDATPAPKKDKPTPPTSTSVKLKKAYVHAHWSGFYLSYAYGVRTSAFEQWFENCTSNCKNKNNVDGYGLYFPLSNQQTLIGLAFHGHGSGNQFGPSVIHYFHWHTISQKKSGSYPSGWFLRMDLGSASVSSTPTWDSGRKETFQKSGPGILLGLGLNADAHTTSTLFYAARPGYSRILGLMVGFTY